MSDSSPRAREVDALLVARATEGLGEPDQLRLTELLALDPSLEHDEHERAAAAIALAMLGPDRAEPMPDSLRATIAAQVPPHVEVPRAPLPEPKPRSTWPSWTGWAVAAAAVLLLALLELRRPPPATPSVRPVIVMTEPAAAPPKSTEPPQPPTPSPAEQRQRLLQDDPGALVAAWTAASDPTGRAVSGDVVWSERDQQGFMRLRDLQPNDPRREVYQLWIFDADRDERFPVDGGVFSVASGRREVVVPIDARLPVSRATLFAVTVEPPGGVVVSDRSRLAALAKVSS
ncbi:MAG: anti-sigma factor [Nannocystaceae bacterium]